MRQIYVINAWGVSGGSARWGVWRRVGRGGQRCEARERRRPVCRTWPGGLGGAAWPCARGRRGARRCAAAGSAGVWVRSARDRRRAAATASRRQVVRDQHELCQTRLCSTSRKGQVAQAGVLVVADVISTPARAVTAFELGDVGPGLVGEGWLGSGSRRGR